MQVSTGAEAKINSAMILRKTIQSEGILGLFRGYSTTVLREVPFSFIQMPLWEWLKRSWANYNGQEHASPVQSAICGAISGTVLPPNSRVLGPGIFRVLQIRELEV